MRRFHAIAYQVAICELGTLSRWALPQHQDHVHRTSSAATFGTPQPQEVRLLRTKQRLQPELMRWPHPADDEVAGLHVKDVPKERLSCRRDLRLARMHRRLELCADSSVVAPRGWPGAHGSPGGCSVTESDELAFVRGELDRYRMKLGETQIERDRLRAELRDALNELERWHTLAEYREAMLDEQRGNTDRPSEFPSLGRTVALSSRHRRRIT